MENDGNGHADAGPSPLVEALVDEFASTIAHELRAPLTVVHLAAATLAEKREVLSSEQVTKMLQLILRHNELATLLIERLRLARDVDAGAMKLDLQPLDLVALVEEVVSDLRDVVLVSNPTALIAPGPVKVTADGVAVREVLFNLLSNASKYSAPDAQIVVTVDLSDGQARVVVSDNGRGVDVADSDRIFEKYVQADECVSGVGLGLYISRVLARAHGGDLLVLSRPHSGSDFVLTLPVDALQLESPIDPG